MSPIRRPGGSGYESALPIRGLGQAPDESPTGANVARTIAEMVEEVAPAPEGEPADLPLLTQDQAIDELISRFAGDPEARLDQMATPRAREAAAKERHEEARRQAERVEDTEAVTAALADVASATEAEGEATRQALVEALSKFPDAWELAGEAENLKYERQSEYGPDQPDTEAETEAEPVEGEYRDDTSIDHAGGAA